MEGFNEHVVRRVNKPKHLLIRILTILGLILIPVIAVFIAYLTNIKYIIMVGFFLFLGGIYMVWYIFSSQKVDFEYSVSGNDLDISKIVALRKRKRMCRVPINEIDVLTKDEEKIDRMRFTKTYVACRDTDSKGENYFAVFNSPAYGKCLLIFTPNQQILDGMKPRLDKTIVIDLFYRNKKNGTD